MGLKILRKHPISNITVTYIRTGMSVLRTSTFSLLAWLLLVSAGAEAQRYVFQAYRQAEGLKNLSVNTMAIDPKGFLWVATENGVFRFLGSGFERFGTEQGIAEIDVHSLVVDQDGSIWAGTEGNVYRWDGQRFQRAGANPIQIQNEFSMAVEDGRHLLIVDRKRLFRLEHDAQGRTLSYVPLFSDATIAADPSLGEVSSVSVIGEPGSGARIWFGCGKRLCSWLDRPTPSQPNVSDVIEWGRNRNLPDDRWDGVLLDRTGTLWAGGAFHVAALLPGSPNFIDRTIPGSAPNSSHSSHAPLIEDGRGEVFAPANTGLARWNGRDWRFVSAANGLQLTSEVVAMAFDKEGDLWLGIRGEGISKWAGFGEWESWTSDQGLPSGVIWEVAPFSSDRLLAGTDQGPAWVSKETGAAGSLYKGRWSFGEVDTIGVDQDGSLWAGTLSGSVLHIDPKSGRTAEAGKLPATILVGVPDHAGRLFLGTRDGVWMRETEGRTTTFKRVTAVDALIPAHAEFEAGCLAPNGDLWLSAQNRLLREENNVWTEPPIDGSPKLPGDLLALSCAQDGSIWATGEQDGVWRFTPHGNRLEGWQLPIPPGLQSLAPLAILSDHRGWIWLGTDLGVLAWNGHEWRHLTRETGLIWNDIDQNALTEDQDGSLWIGTSGGLSHLLHPERVFDPQPISISITGVERGGKTVSYTNDLAMRWTREPLDIQISSPTMRNRSELVFQYQMTGLDSGWIDSQNGEAVFSGLPPGDYLFSARAANQALNAVSETQKIRISVSPPWWRSSWMLSLGAFSVLVLLWGGHRMYEGHLLVRSKELEAQVSERTRELEASRAQLRIQATHDELTGLLNRKAILAALESEMRRAVRDSTTVAVALVDIDHFKQINDVCGHLAGDAALRLFADAVRQVIRSYDQAGRYGGEEFLLVLSRMPLAEIKARLSNIQRSISNLSFQWGEHEFNINCSAGVAVYDLSTHLCTLEALLSAADQSLYKAKASGRNCVVFSDVCWPGAKAAVTPIRHRQAAIS